MNYLKKLGANNIKKIGNLKFSYSSSEFKNKLNSKIKKIFRKKKIIFLAISTHNNEELFCGKVHNNLKKKYKNIISIIIPRHIHRANEIKEDLNSNNLEVHLHTSNRPIHAILFNRIGTNKYYLFVNLHNYHKSTRPDRNTLINDINEVTIKIVTHYSSLQNDEKDLTIILAGDYNDEDRRYYEGFKLHNYDIKAYDINNLPKSLNDKVSDYVLSNKHIKQMYMPLSDEWKNKSQSDHYPVVAVLKID